MEAQSITLNDVSKSRANAKLYVNEDTKKKINSQVLDALVNYCGEQKAVFIFNEAKEATEENSNLEFQALLSFVKQTRMLEEESFNFIVSGISSTAEKFLKDITGERDAGSVVFNQEPFRLKVSDSEAFDEFFCVNTYMQNEALLNWDRLEEFNPGKVDFYRDATASYMLEKNKTQELQIDKQGLRALAQDIEAKDDDLDLTRLLANKLLDKRTLDEWQRPEDFISFMLAREELRNCECFLGDDGLKNQRTIISIKFYTVLEFIEKQMCNINNFETRQIAMSMLKELQKAFPVLFGGFVKPCVANGGRCVKPANKSCGLYPSIKGLEH